MFIFHCYLIFIYKIPPCQFHSSRLVTQIDRLLRGFDHTKLTLDFEADKIGEIE